MDGFRYEGSAMEVIQCAGCAPAAEFQYEGLVKDSFRHGGFVVECQHAGFVFRCGGSEQGGVTSLGGDSY